LGGAWALTNLPSTFDEPEAKRGLTAGGYARVVWLKLRRVAVWEERAGRNEALFRAVNDNIAGSEEQMDSVSDSFSVFCECAKADCTMHVEISLTEYVRVRRHAHRFIVVPGHEQPDIEQVVERHRDYWVVEKHGEAAAAADAES
jgi:hypothetical protein